MVRLWVLVHSGPEKSQKLLGLKLHIVALLNSGNKVKYLQAKLNAHKKDKRRTWLTQEIAKSSERPKKSLLHYSWSFRCSTGERRSVSCTCIPIISFQGVLQKDQGESKHKSSKQKTLPYLLSIAHVHNHHRLFFFQTNFATLKNVQIQVPANSSF
jgi:hypothetical protein